MNKILIRTEDKPNDERTRTVEPVYGWDEYGAVKHDR